MAIELAEAPEPMCEPEGQRMLWLAVRQGLLLIVGAIEKRYGLTRNR